MLHPLQGLFHVSIGTLHLSWSHSSSGLHPSRLFIDALHMIVDGQTTYLDSQHEAV